MKKFMATILVSAMALVAFVIPVSAETSDPLGDFMWEQLTILLELSLELDLCENETNKIVCTYPIATDESIDEGIDYSISRHGETVNISLNQTELKVSYHQNSQENR